MIKRVTHLEDPNLLPFRALKGNHAPRRQGLFIVEGEMLVQRLLQSNIEVVSLLVSERLGEKYAVVCPEDTQVFVANDEHLSAIVGFDFHRGVLACGRRPASCNPEQGDRDTSESLSLLAQGGVIVACPLIHDPENLGLIVRTIAGLGANGLLVSDRGADVFARRCLRVSMGAAFTLPIVQSPDMTTTLRTLHRDHGFQLIATSLADGAMSLDAFEPAKRFVLLMGSEPDGLSPDITELADACIKMEMQRGIDSHNVAVATGIVLHDLMQKRHGI